MVGVGIPPSNKISTYISNRKDDQIVPRRSSDHTHAHTRNNEFIQKNYNLAGL